MNNKGSISIFLLIIVTGIFSIFYIMWTKLSIESYENNVIRSTKLVSRNMMADYDDYMYDNFNILSYSRKTNESIENRIESSYNEFSSIFNAYKIKNVEVIYTGENILNEKKIYEQAIFFTKEKLGVEVVEEILKNITKSEKFNEIQNKVSSILEKTKLGEELEATRKKILKIQESDRVKVAKELWTMKEKYSEYVEYSVETVDKVKSLLEIEETKSEEITIEYLENVDKRLNEELKLGEIEKASVLNVSKVYEEYQIILKNIEDKEDDLKKIKDRIDDLEKEIRFIENLDDSESLIEAEVSKLERKTDNLDDKVDDVKEVLDNLKIDLFDLEIKLNENVDKYVKLLNKNPKEFPNLKESIDVIKILKNQVQEKFEEIVIPEELLLEKSDLTKFEDSNLLEKQFFDEYILGNFKSIAKSNVRDFDFNDKWKRKSYMNSEVEYIIEGDRFTLKNNVEILAKISALRTALNIAHIFIDNDKRLFIMEFATIPYVGYAVSGAVSLAWGTGETILDDFEIYNGGGTPFLKISDEHFKLDEELIKDIGKLKKYVEREYLPDNKTIEKIEEITFFYYYDYLRIFLKTVKLEDKIKRTLDVISLNYNKFSKEKVEIENLMLEHKIEVIVTFENKFTNKEEVVKYNIFENYIRGASVNYEE